MTTGWHDKFPDLRPDSGVPWIASRFGSGTRLYGRRGFDAETSTYIKTRCLCLLYLPIVALDAWRVAKAANGGWMLVGRCPLSWLARVANLLCLLLVVGLLCRGWWGLGSRKGMATALVVIQLAWPMA